MADLTVLYDEGCGFCTALAVRLATRRGVAAEAIGSPVGAAALRDLTPAERYASLHVVDDLGRRRSGGAALPPLLRALPLGAPFASAAEASPTLTDACYRLVARNRARLSRTARRLGLL